MYIQVVLDRITAFSEYTKMVSGVAECGNYAEVTHRNKTRTLKTHMVFKLVPGWKLGGYFVHTYYPPPLSSVRDLHELPVDWSKCEVTGSSVRTLRAPSVR